MAGADADARASASEYARIIDGLSATLQLEVVERQRLEAQIEALGDKIGRLEGQLADARGPDPDFFVTAGDAAAADAEAEVDNAARAALAPFLEAGFDPERAEYVKQLQDELQLQRLYVRDQAEREGWIRTPRYRARKACSRSWAKPTTIATYTPSDVRIASSSEMCSQTAPRSRRGSRSAMRS
jgi:hypothetical protein